MKGIALLVAVVSLVLAVGCGSDKKRQPSPAATEVTTATATATASATNVPAETLFDLPVKQLKLGAPVPLPTDVALYIESGCFGCDAPPVSLERLYRVGNSAVREDELFRVPGATRASPAPGGKYISSVAISVGGSDILLSVCESPYCGGVGEQQPGATTSIRHSTDGGVTWKDEGTLEGWAVVLANAGPGRNGLLRRSYPSAGVPRFEFAYFPSLATTPIELRGQAPQSSRILVTSGPPLLLDPDGLRLYRLDGAPTNAPQYEFPALPRGSRIQDLQLIPGTNMALLTFGSDTSVYSAIVDISRAPDISFKEVYSWPGERPYFGGAQESFIDARTWVVPVGLGAGNVPAIVNFDTGTISPITELVGRATAGDRLLVKAVTTGPFARVKGAGTGDCLNVRESASLTAPAFACYADGVLLRELGQRQTADGQVWMLVDTPAGRRGWASTVFLETSGSAPSLNYHPAGKRTGNAEIDVIIAALESAAPVPQTLIGWQKVACMVPPINGLGGPPECPAGVADKTLLDVIPGSSCEGFWRIRPAGGGAVTLSAGPPDRLYAVVRQDGTRAEFALIYVNPERPEFGQSVFVSGGKVVGDAQGCGASPADVAKRGTGVVLAPP